MKPSTKLLNYVDICTKTGVLNFPLTTTICTRFFFFLEFLLVLELGIPVSSVLRYMRKICRAHNSQVTNGTGYSYAKSVTNQ